MNNMRRLLVVPILVFCCCRHSFGQAPDTISGDSYRDATGSIAPFVYFNAMEFHSDGTYTTRALMIAATVQGVGSYSPLVNGTFIYNKQSPSEASIILNSSSGISETLSLSFSKNLEGSVSRGPSGASRSGDFSLSPPPNGASTSLINISTLVTVRQGNPVTIGFVIGGSKIREFLIRAVGPSLSSFAVASPASDPVYSLIGQSASITPMPGAAREGLFPSLGDGWSGAPQQASTIAAEAARAGAFPLSIGSNDKADIYLLSPGAYTVIVNPPSSASEGTVLIEAYEVQ
jgi:hypothetical protein